VNAPRNSPAKVLLTIWGVFTPYYVWIFYCIGCKKLPPNPWPAVIFLSYLFVGYFVVRAILRRRPNQSLADSQSSNSLEVTASVSVPKVVWISSLEHLQRFRELPWYRKWSGLLPSCFPRVRLGIISYPLIYFAQGTLNLNGSDLKLSTFVPPSDGMKVYANLVSDLQLSLSPDQVRYVTRFDMRQIVRTALPVPFIRIQTITHDLPDFLVCSGSGDMSVITRETENLWYALAAFVSKRRTV
jgi:hypothetical protein